MTGELIGAYPLVRTDRIEELQDAFDRVFVRPVLQPIGRDRALQALHNHCSLAHMGVSYGSYAIGMHFRFPEPRAFLQIFPVSGQARVMARRTDIALDPRWSAIISAGTGMFDIHTNGAYQRLGLIIETEPLMAKLVAMLGAPVPAPLTFDPMQDFSQPLARRLRENFMFLVSQLNADAPLPPLMLAEFEQALMVMFLYANRNNYSHLLHRAPPDAAAQQVRMAEEFIEANWSRPVSLEELAAITGLGIRSLFRTFRRIRGHSPLDFLRQVRLRQARARLRCPEDATAVLDVAFACGFRDAERFGASYVQAFGEQPEETLKRGKGLRLH